ncbi:MAG: hypothetical protein PHH75_01815 [Candidatus Omnitrophica bacterium]|nr:hypothetical protein [Candidatus Omnitrophota bacterium]MDD5573896.1 hypothetical protein [Candidatus Omnitrophota bacterium]
MKRFCRLHGADLFGVADVSNIKDGFELVEDVKQGHNRAVCLGVGLSGSILSEIEGQPTKLYFHHYRTANAFLDQMAFAVSRWIESRGAAALPIPASQILDWQKQNAHLSHKKIGRLAGLGWIGRNNLLVSPTYGAQFRMVTILTDMKLRADRPLEGGCGPCRACIAACPVGAIRERCEDFGHLECFEKLKSFQRENVVGQYICGICVKVCGGKHGKKNTALNGLVEDQQGHHI